VLSCMCVCVRVTDRCVDTSILQIAIDARHAAEASAKQLLSHADGCPAGHSVSSTAGSPWEDLSSSRTARYVTSFIWVSCFLDKHCHILDISVRLELIL